MGSIDKACISGFLCRLCSEMHRTVIHIYGDEGKRLGLVEKINGYLPITISPADPLPKTICQSCLRRVEQHYELLLRLSRIKDGRYLRVYPRIGQQNLDADDADEEEPIPNSSSNSRNSSLFIGASSLYPPDQDLDTSSSEESLEEEEEEEEEDPLNISDPLNAYLDTDFSVDVDAHETEELILGIEIDMQDDNDDVEAEETNDNLEFLDINQ